MSLYNCARRIGLGLGLDRAMYKAIQHHFRSGHISMAPTLSLKNLLATTNDPAFPLKSDGVHVTQTFNGSAALSRVAATLKLSAGDVVLLPAYCCGAEIGPFEHRGCRCEFFDVDENLNANVAQIEQILTREPAVKAVMLTHYFGFAQKNTAKVFELCEKNNVALLEDCAHALFSNDGSKALGSFGHFAIFSPRKSLPLTEGGLLLANKNAVTDATAQQSRPALIPRWQRLFYSLLQNARSTDSQSLASSVFRTMYIALLTLPAIAIKIAKKLPIFKNAVWLSADAEGEDAVPIYNTAMSESSFAIMQKTNIEFTVVARINNYRLWLAELTRVKESLKAMGGSASKAAAQCAPLLPELPQGCCPLYFPIIVQNPGHVKQYLAEQDIECFNWWQHKHEAVDWALFPVAAKLKSCVVALPAHQQLSAKQIRIMANALEQSLIPT